MGFLDKIFEPYDGPALPKTKLFILGMQHTFTMFGSTVLVPIITGLSISVSLFMAGLCTLLFHVTTKGKVPIFLGSSFAFIAPIMIVSETFGQEYALGGIFVAGIVYLIMALLVYFIGADAIMKFFPPIVTGPIIMIIGLMLAPVAIDMASGNWLLAFCSFATVAGVSMFAKGFLRMLPVMCGLIVGYIVSFVTGNVDFSTMEVAAQLPGGGILGVPDFKMAQFNIAAVMIVAPVAIATIVEHIGDIVAVSETCEKDFIKSPGLHRTLIGDGLACCVSSLFGGPASTTYAENTGVLVLTRVFNPWVMRIAAFCAIILGFVPILAGFISTIPSAVIGGISIVLFGMIASVGMRTLVENQVDFKNPRNLLIGAVVLVLGLGGAVLPVNLGVSFELSGVGLAAIVGIILNKVFPEKQEG